MFDLKAVEQVIKEASEFRPYPVVERVSNSCFNAECAFQGKHYVVAKDKSTYEEALQFATNHVNAVKKAMVVAGLNLCSGYPVAKE